MNGWGAPYGNVRYQTPDGLVVWLYRQRQACRWFTADGQQVGPEQPNVAPAVAYALANGWRGVAVTTT